MIDADDLLGAGLGSVTHPDPYQPIERHGWVAPHAKRRRNTLHPGYAGAAARTIEDHAVISALDFVTDDPPHRQRQFAMEAGVLQGNGFARLRAIQDDAVADDPDRPGFPGHLVIPGSYVPSVSQEQGHLLEGKMSLRRRRSAVDLGRAWARGYLTSKAYIVETEALRTSS